MIEALLIVIAFSAGFAAGAWWASCDFDDDNGSDYWDY